MSIRWCHSPASNTPTGFHCTCNKIRASYHNWLLFLPLHLFTSYCCLFPLYVSATIYFFLFLALPGLLLPGSARLRPLHLLSTRSGTLCPLISVSGSALKAQPRWPQRRLYWPPRLQQASRSQLLSSVLSSTVICFSIFSCMKWGW